MFGLRFRLVYQYPDGPLSELNEVVRCHNYAKMWRLRREMRALLSLPTTLEGGVSWWKE